MKILGSLIAIIGALVALVDVWRVLTLGHDWHMAPMLWAGTLILLGMYPERMIGLLEKLAPAAADRIRGRQAPMRELEMPPPASAADEEDR